MKRSSWARTAMAIECSLWQSLKNEIKNQIVIDLAAMFIRNMEWEWNGRHDYYYWAGPQLSAQCTQFNSIEKRLQNAHLICRRFFAAFTILADSRHNRIWDDDALGIALLIKRYTYLCRIFIVAKRWHHTFALATAIAKRCWRCKRHRIIINLQLKEYYKMIIDFAHVFRTSNVFT